MSDNVGYPTVKLTFNYIFSGDDRFYSETISPLYPVSSASVVIRGLTSLIFIRQQVDAFPNKQEIYHNNSKL